MNRIFNISLMLILLASCAENNEPLKFEETHIAHENGPLIELNFPKASSYDEKAKKVNALIEETIAAEMSLSEEIKEQSIDTAIKSFNKEFNDFQSNFPDSEQQWEMFVDGEVIYESPEIISISLSTYTDTGGAHGNTHVVFLNLDPETGNSIPIEEIIKDEEKFKELAIKYFKEKISKKKHDLDIVDSFYGKDFMLPETIGFSEEGVVILYNTYEIAAYSFGITEYVIPYSEASKYLDRL